MRLAVTLLALGVATAQIPTGPPISSSIEVAHDNRIDLNYLRMLREVENHRMRAVIYNPGAPISSDHSLSVARIKLQDRQRAFAEQSAHYNSAYRQHFANNYQGSRNFANSRALLHAASHRVESLYGERNGMVANRLNDVLATGQHHSQEQLKHDREYAEALKEQERALAMVDAFGHYQ